MTTLRQLIGAIDDADRRGERILPCGPIRFLTSDTREVRQGSVFVALRGGRLDGHDFVGRAVENGCCAVVVERAVEVPDRTSVVRVADTHRAYGRMAAALYGYPAREMTMIGLTGTNGKTTTSWIIEELLIAAGLRPGVIGTVNYRYRDGHGGAVVRDAPLTTPEPILLHELLREMKSAGVTHVVMEVSSHALVQQRLAGMVFDAAVFTNLSRDHLDYHRTMDEYFTAKQRLFMDHLKEEGLAVVVVDDDREVTGEGGTGWGGRLAGNLRQAGFVPFTAVQRQGRSLITCGLRQDSMVRAGSLKQDIDGLVCTILLDGERLRLHSPLIGRHNVLNMLTAAGVGLGLGMKPEIIRRGLERIRRVPGRLERVRLPSFAGDESNPRVFVDYAHTPEALENVLLTLRPVTKGMLVCVFGCGGDRDRGKRPMMGEAAARLADRLLITSDNPRTEDPAAIIREIEAGVGKLDVELTDIPGLFGERSRRKKYTVLEDRRQAIHAACALAGKDDVVLIAGKGHERYQITAAGKRFFDDRLEAGNGRLRWTMDHLLAATGGSLEQSGSSGLLGEISTDTRTLKPGDVFLALKGESFDGHDFVETAIDRGAAALIVNKLCAAGSVAGVIRVADTLRALGDLAHYRRRALAADVQVIGITGSSGKTTVKEMTAAIFQTQFVGSDGEPVLKTGGNLNNLIGLPLSLLQLRCGHRTAVMEMGMNRPGEIQRLTAIADPDIGCITNVQTAHLEGLGSIEGVARAKGELFGTMPGRSIRVINFDDPHIRSMGVEHGNNVIGFAVTPDGRRYHPQVRATRIRSLGEAGMRFTLHVGEWRRRITVPATGAHNVANCAAAAAIAIAGGVDPETIARGLLRYRSGDKRLEISDLPGGIKVLNDSYNANPSSMAAALRTVKDFGRDCRRIAALGDMLELGESSVAAHRQIGALAAKVGIDYLVVTGIFAGTVAEAARRAGMQKNRVKQCGSAGEAARWIAGLIDDRKVGKGDWLLVKGSRGMRMEQVLTDLHRLLING
jgi:MurE/MurF fusion protein